MIYRGIENGIVIYRADNPEGAACLERLVSEVLRLRYMDDMTLTEVGQLRGVGYESIRKMEE